MRPRSFSYSITAVVTCFGLASLSGRAATPDTLALENATVRLAWMQTPSGWTLDQANVRSPNGWVPIGRPTGRYTVLFSPVAPDDGGSANAIPGVPEGFPEPYHKFILPRWRQATGPVSLNTMGQVFAFQPEHARQDGPALEFSHRTEVADLTARWEIDPQHPADVKVVLTLTARRAGWFSLATPALATLPPDELAWGMVPGYFQGDRINPNFMLSYGYGHGLPDRPVVVRERAASTLAPLMTNRAGVTLAVVPAPGTAADPWASDRNTRPVWRLGLSHMDRAGRISPTLYHPVLGEEGSQLAAGEQVHFRFHYVARQADWFSILKHVARDIYDLPRFLALKRPVRSLSDRLAGLHRYLTDDQTSLWRTEKFGEMTLGAQAYISAGVLGSDDDAMKNSDYGAMWMLARITKDPRLVEDRLPFARNFKLAQQQVAPGFFQGAATGQYYLSKSQRFTEEWGDYVEPVALTYYALLDMGNILLFNPTDTELRERLRLGADRLLSWQRPAGNWDVAYDRNSHAPLFQELPDLRPTFYGLVVAHRLLGDDKYLQAARRAADWLLANAIAPGRFLGVCGDTRFAPDFATAQIAQALLDLHEITGDSRYRDGGIAAARFYTASIYTHPLATNADKHAGGASRQDWEINQSGLSFEHGGTLGTANTSGPILLASHAGLFVRIAQLTREDFFLELARAAVWARDAFLNPETSAASYYWAKMNAGPTGFPHHGWWQIGWITDYLISEATYRSNGAISFPRGFFTPKVGPHASYGFAQGSVYGQVAELRWDGVTTDRPEVDTLITASPDGSFRVVVLNNSVRPQTVTVAVDIARLTQGRQSSWQSVAVLDAKGLPQPPAPSDPLRITLPAAGLAVIVLQ